MQSAREYSDDTARLIDEEIAKILRQQEDRARMLLATHRRGLDLIAQALLEDETVDGPQVNELIHQGMAESAAAEQPSTAS